MVYYESSQEYCPSVIPISVIFSTLVQSDDRNFCPSAGLGFLLPTEIFDRFRSFVIESRKHDDIVLWTLTHYIPLIFTYTSVKISDSSGSSPWP